MVDGGFYFEFRGIYRVSTSTANYRFRYHSTAIEGFSTDCSLLMSNLSSMRRFSGAPNKDLNDAAALIFCAIHHSFPLLLT